MPSASYSFISSGRPGYISRFHRQSHWRRLPKLVSRLPCQSWHQTPDTAMPWARDRATSSRTRAVPPWRPRIAPP